jgi:hypothetical protein
LKRRINGMWSRQTDMGTPEETAEANERGQAKTGNRSAI